MSILKEAVEKLRKKFENYENYYKILEITEQGVTDEIVENAYKSKIKEYEKFLTDPRIPNENKQEIEELLEQIKIALTDAYTALKTENSRKNYQELLNSINSQENPLVGDER